MRDKPDKHLRLVRDDEVPVEPSVRIENVEDRFTDPPRCRHLQVIVDEKERRVTCSHCKVEVDPIQALLDVGAWCDQQMYRWKEIKEGEFRGQCDSESHLTRQRRPVMVSDGCRVYYDGPDDPRVPADAVKVGDYLSGNGRFRIREVEGQWTVRFWDREHGLKPIATLTRSTLAQVRSAVRDHWRAMVKNGVK